MLTRRCFLLLALFNAVAFAEVAPSRLEEQARAYADLGKFSGAVVVARDGKPLLAQGYGKANLEWDIPNSPDTKFRLGSITKQFTGMAILMLEEQGKLGVNDPISKLIPESPDKWKAITIHHLLTHTSGIYNFTVLPDYNTKVKREPLTPLQAMKLVTEKELEFEPGTKHRYSNSGYILLGLIVERGSGMKYDEFLKRNIFDPLGMSDTGYDWNRTVVPRRASGYTQRAQGPVNADFIDMNIPHGAGALYSTVNDFIKWDAALRERRLLKPESYEKYFKPFLNNYAYGWVSEERHGAMTQGHGGGIDGFSTTFIRVPSQNLMVVAFSNVVPNEGGKLARELLSLAMGHDAKVPVKRPRIDLPETTLRSYIGEYEISPTFVVTITLENGQLMAQPTNQAKMAVLAEAEDVFYPMVLEATLRFQKDQSGKVTGLVLEQGERKMSAKKR